MTTSEETIREAARVLADLEAATHGRLPYSDISWACVQHEWIPRARALDAAGLLRQEMTEETRCRELYGVRFDERRYVTKWEEVPDGE